MNCQLIFYLAFSLALFCQLHSSITPEEEAWIPFHARLLEDCIVFQESESIALNKDLRFVVIRVEGNTVTADISRKGVFKLPLSATDIKIQIEATKKNSKRPIPRMAQFLGNRIMSGSSGWDYPIRLEEVSRFHAWFLLYLDPLDKKSPLIMREVETFYQRLNQKKPRRTALVLLDPTGNKSAIAKMSEDFQPSFQLMPAYLSRGYSKSFGHYDSAEELPLLVELSSSGRILKRFSGVDAILAFLGE